MEPLETWREGEKGRGGDVGRGDVEGSEGGVEGEDAVEEGNAGAVETRRCQFGVEVRRIAW